MNFPLPFARNVERRAIGKLTFAFTLGSTGWGANSVWKRREFGLVLLGGIVCEGLLTDNMAKNYMAACFTLFHLVYKSPWSCCLAAAWLWCGCWFFGCFGVCLVVWVLFLFWVLLPGRFSKAVFTISSS